MTFRHLPMLGRHPTCRACTEPTAQITKLLASTPAQKHPKPSMALSDRSRCYLAVFKAPLLMFRYSFNHCNDDMPGVALCGKSMRVCLVQCGVACLLVVSHMGLLLPYPVKQVRACQCAQAGRAPCSVASFASVRCMPMGQTWKHWWWMMSAMPLRAVASRLCKCARERGFMRSSIKISRHPPTEWRERPENCKTKRDVVFNRLNLDPRNLRVNLIRVLLLEKPEVSFIFTYGSVATSKQPLEDLSQPTRSFTGLRCYTETLSHPGVVRFVL